MGNVNLTSPAISFFLNREIEVIFMNQYGKYKGKLCKDEYRNVDLRISQYEKSRDKSFALKISKEIVKGKLKNYFNLLNMKNKSEKSKDIERDIDLIYKMIKKTDNAKEIKEIRGIEGIGTKYYFDSYKRLIKNDEFSFVKRISHPPKDKINSLLSLGYSLLYNEIAAAMNIVGLDPYFGNLHSIQMSKKSLLFDMVEEYRGYVIDNFILTMINRKEIKGEDFEESCNKGIYLKNEKMKLFLKKYESMLAEKRRYLIDNEMNYLRVIFEKQARRYALAVLGKVDNYKTYNF